MALFPLSSNFERDFVLQLLAVDSENTMDEVAAAAAEHSINRRVRPQPDKILRVRQHSTGKLFPRDMKVCESNLMPSETVDIIFADE
jgi:toluene monooxygenase system protein B